MSNPSPSEFSCRSVFCDLCDNGPTANLAVHPLDPSLRLCPTCHPLIVAMIAQRRIVP